MTSHDDSTRDAERMAAGRDGAVDPDSVEPTNTVIGVVPRSGDADQAVAALEDIGIDSGRIRRLQGKAGIAALEPDGNRVVEKLGSLLSEATEFRDQLIRALSRGQCAIMVTEVDDDFGHELRTRMQDVGLEEVHHFGDWVAE